MPTACAVRCAESIGGGRINWPALVLFACFIGAWLYHTWRSRHGLWISSGHPLMREAQRKAQASLEVLRAEHDPPGAPARVKFRLDAGTETPELVWAELLMLGREEFTARIATPPRFQQRGIGDDPVILPLAQLLDWQVNRDDGSIRGGYTTQVEIRLRRQAGKRLPEALLAMRDRFVDR
jgi:hypothetical protein